MVLLALQILAVLVAVVLVMGAWAAQAALA
jgi:hypothetical protein